MRMRKKPNLEPRMEKCAHLLVPHPEDLRGRWLQTFGREQIRLELGCGRGRFIAEMAKNSPNVLFVAIEKTANVLVCALELAVRESLQNALYVNAYADRLSEFFAPGEISAIYINFCDPWPSNRHRKRRLVCEGYLRIYKEILRSGGEICFKTDNLPLFEFALREFDSCGFALAGHSMDLHAGGPAGVMTEYEQKFHSLGQPIYWCMQRG